MVAQMYYVESGDVMDADHLVLWIGKCLPAVALKGKQSAEARVRCSSLSISQHSLATKVSSQPRPVYGARF
jgi:hypothetical protein